MSDDGFFRAFKGWLAACGAATACISVFFLTLMAIVPGGHLRGAALAVLLIAVIVFVIACTLTAIPSALVIWLSERFQIRSVVFFSCLGAAIGVSSQTLLFWGFTEFSWLFVFAGCAAGVNYWRVAGRHAGRDCRCASRRSQTAASATRAVADPNTSSNARLSAMSTSAIVTSWPRSTSEVTP
jgi:hypothetical protein